MRIQGFTIVSSDYPDQMNEIFGMVEFYGGLGLMVSPVAGSGVYYLMGFQGVFWLMMGVFCFAVPTIYYSLGPDRPYRGQSHAGSKPIGLMFRPRILFGSLIHTSIAPHLLTFNLTQIEIGEH